MKPSLKLIAALLFIAVAAMFISSLFAVPFAVPFIGLLAASCIAAPKGALLETLTAPVLEALENMKTEFSAKMKADAKKEATDVFTEQIKAIDEEIKKIKGLPADFDPEKLKQMHEDLQVTVKAIDKLQVMLKGRSNTPAAPVTFGSEFGEKLKAKEAELKKFKTEKKGFGKIDLESKAVGNMSASNLTGDYFVTPQVVPGVQLKLYETVHMRNILPVGNTNSDTIRYVQDNGGEGGAGMVAMGGLKPQTDRDLEIKDSPVRKIATHFRVPEEMIDDIPYLQSFLVDIGMEEVMLLEDTQVLYGDGTGQNLEGIMVTATAFTAGTSTVAAPNKFDVLLAAKKQGRKARTNPTVALVSPDDFYEMITTKDANNNYIFLGGGNGIDVQGVLRGRGLPTIIEHTSIANDDFLVIDPRNAAIFDRTGTSVRFYDQDQDNAIRNLITIVIEKRLALTKFRTDGTIKGTFTAAVTDLAA